MTQTRRLCFVDLDGVLADFVGQVCLAHNRPNPYSTDTPECLGVFDMDKIWGITGKEFWEPTKGEKFWHEMEKTPEADELVDFVVGEFGEENVAILSAPSMDPYCVPGKRAWVRRHYPQFENKLLFGSAKQFLAGEGRWLLDDRDKNVEEFNRFGGNGVLVPRLWNSTHSQAGTSEGVIRRVISRVLAGTA